ncbi:uncharacterized protein CEXT_323461 [Caerostris extrusa]|uniref:Gustatory receptor n=1 Tax=Caerostris extrusa TaxID=172846 RepID=A0AAV4SBQ4_CAEEX|nr:uncharacterized protein CEXT_323461 [Caerostris extrusa]
MSKNLSTTLSSTHDLLKKKRWYHRRPLLRNALFTDLQNGSYIASIYTLVQSIFTQILSVFDIYIGNKHIRNLLILCSVISFILAVYMLVVSVILMRALRKELEQKFRPSAHSSNRIFILVVLSNFQELADITRLEDMARLKTGTMSSLNTTSHSLSHYSVNMLGGAHSRASTPHGSNFAVV